MQIVPLPSRSPSLVARCGAVAQRRGARPEGPTLVTTRGRHRRRARSGKAPKTVDNFLQYVKAGHYDGTIFHRVIDNFMIQGGGMTADMKEKPTRAPIALESQQRPRPTQRGTSRWRAPPTRTRRPRSSSSTSRTTPSSTRRKPRDGNGYAVFGKVVEGMDVVDKIKAVHRPTGPGDVPGKPSSSSKATVEK